MKRALGGAERQWWMQSQRVPCNIALTTCIDAPVDRKTFEGAMGWLQKRYPLLAAGLEVVNDEPWFVTADDPRPIPVTWMERTGREDWRTAGARTLGVGFEEKGPFLRFLVLAGADATDVILCVSHMLLDGLSMAQITTDVLHYLHDPQRAAVPMEEKGTLAERAPKAIRGKWLPFARYVAKQIFDAPNDPARNARLAAGYHGRTSVDWITIELAPEETEKLRVASRAQKTTIQGALTAAMSLAVGEHEARYGRKRVAVHSPINLRGLLEPPAAGEIGNFAAGTTTWVQTDASLWDIARTVKSDIDQAIARGAPFASDRLTSGAKRKAPRTSPRWIALRVWPDLGVTNLGQVALPETPMAAKVREMHVLVALPVMQTFVCATVTVRGRLFCDFHFCPDDIARDAVIPLAESARRHLQAALG